jgi:hypothetical protein
MIIMPTSRAIVQAGAGQGDDGAVEPLADDDGVGDEEDGRGDGELRHAFRLIMRVGRTDPARNKKRTAELAVPTVSGADTGRAATPGATRRAHDDNLTRRLTGR